MIRSFASGYIRRSPTIPSLEVAAGGIVRRLHHAAWGAVMLKAHQLLAPFAVSDRLVRTSVHRLQVDGWLVSRRQGALVLFADFDGLRRFMNA
jgi:DNA-binding transcriptional regulator PaaX